MAEIVVDANVLLRFLLDDPRPLADRAAAIIEAAERLDVDLIVTPLTVAEVVYVLGSVYGWSRADIAARLLELLEVPSLTILEEDVVRQALEWYRDVSRVHFADAYVAATALGRGHGAVATFDREMRRVPNIRIVDDAAAVERD